MNKSHLTRKEQVLRRLQEDYGKWVDGPELANEQVGGSEGLKRLRELREDGYHIQTRKHPDPRRDIWQYRIIGHGDRVIDPEQISQDGDELLEALLREDIR